MTDTARFALALVAGVLLGAMCFAGLWWTVRRGLIAGNPALWFGASGLLRMSLVLAGLYLAARAGSPSLLACLFGLVLARSVATRLARVAR